MKHGLFFYLAGLLLLTACDNKVVFEENKPVPDASWEMNQPVSFEFEITDTVSLHNFYVNVRNEEGYRYSNLYLFIEMEFPNGKKSVDTLNCPLADPQGKWYGTGLGDLYDQRLIFKEKKQFPLAGHYRVDIYQAMRDNPLTGIHDVGFRLARAYAE